MRFYYFFQHCTLEYVFRKLVVINKNKTKNCCVKNAYVYVCMCVCVCLIVINFIWSTFFHLFSFSFQILIRLGVKCFSFFPVFSSTFYGKQQLTTLCWKMWGWKAGLLAKKKEKKHLHQNLLGFHVRLTEKGKKVFFFFCKNNLTKEQTFKLN